jgi:hypothetical protein
MIITHNSYNFNPLYINIAPVTMKTSMKSHLVYFTYFSSIPPNIAVINSPIDVPTPNSAIEAAPFTILIPVAAFTSPPQINPHGRKPKIAPNRKGELIDVITCALKSVKDQLLNANIIRNMPAVISKIF